MLFSDINLKGIKSDMIANFEDEISDIEIDLPLHKN